MFGDFAPFVSLILAIFVFALAAKAPAVGFPALIAAGPGVDQLSLCPLDR